MHNNFKSLQLCSLLFILIATSIATSAGAQSILEQSPSAGKWVDSVYQSLTPDQRIAQLMVIRESAPGPVIYEQKIHDLIKKYNIGAICLFQGEPAEQAVALNKFQRLAQTPLMVCIDGETGLGMRMKKVRKFPDQLTLGAMRNGQQLVGEIGQAMAEQCKRMGIQVDYAPVVDINNNPDNPVIGYRSFGQDKHTVADYGTAIMKGLQSGNILACAKHFPGHGDVSVDSHKDLPVIHKSLAALDTLELYPFKQVFKEGIGSVMIAHLSIPKIDNTPHLASSLSHKFVTDLLRKQLDFTGISFTDALEMKGVAKYFAPGEVSVMSLIAGNDMLCLPGNIAVSLQKINAALTDGRLQWDDLEGRIKKVLYAKYNLGLADIKERPIQTKQIVKDLNRQVEPLNQAVAKSALTAVTLENGQFKSLDKGDKIAFVQIGGVKADLLSSRMTKKLNARGFYFDYSDSKQMAAEIRQKIKGGKFDRVIITIGHYSKRPANNFQISKNALQLIHDIQYYDHNTLLAVMGNPYAIKNFLQFRNLIVTYQDGPAFQGAVFDFLTGKQGADGRLPVTVSTQYPFGTGLVVKAQVANSQRDKKK